MAKKVHRRKKRGQDVQLGILLAILIVAIVIIATTAPTEANGDVTAEAIDSTVTAESIIRINEVMASNTSALMLSDGSLPDWIELHNTSTSEVSIKGYGLAAGGDASNIYTFSDVRIPAGGYVLMYADEGRTTNDEIHLPFRIPASGTTLVLMNPRGNVVDSVKTPELDRNQVYCRDASGAWQKSLTPTAGTRNQVTSTDVLDVASMSVLHVVSDGAVEITEVMSDNATYCADENGQHGDYIELHNGSNSAIDLTDWYLSDTRGNLARWQFPQVTIPADGYLLIYCSGEDRKDNVNYLHTNFKLGSEGTDVLLTRSDGKTVSLLEVPALETDQAYSLVDGNMTTNFAPTPGRANNLQNAAAISDEIFKVNYIGVYINEIAASTSTMSYDWVELYNASNAAVNLSGYGLSDNASRPRKWQFPEGTVIQPGGYLGVFLSGLDSTSPNALHTNYRIGLEGGYSLVLSRPDGAIFDRVYVPQQYENVTYGRVSGQSGFYYSTLPTPLARNDGNYYYGKAAAPNYSVEGGLFKTGDVLTVELSAPAGCTIYYTLDSTDPSNRSTRYTGPITITGTTILRTRVYANGYLESFIDTQSYLYDVNNGNGVYVVSLVSDPYNLVSDEAGIMVKGPNALSEYPYGSMNVGANFWMDWEREGHVEVFGGDGETVLSAGCGLKMHGQYSRAESQKAFKIIARAQYGTSRFQAALFDKRPYTEYQSFVIRASGQDNDKTRMRDSILSSLAEDTSVMYMETEICVVYIDGQYWGHYNMRERINTASICQFEGWEGDEDALDLIKANSNVMQGSNDTFAALLTWIKNNNTSTDAAYEYISSVIDIQNYIEYMAIQIFTGNTDLLNVKRYRNPNDDGKWRWVLFDLDWAFTTDTNSINRWLTSGGVGTDNRTDNTLFIGLMKNPRFFDEFLTYMGQQMATTFTTESLLERAQERYVMLNPLLDDQFAKWGPTREQYNRELSEFMQYAQERPAKLLSYFMGTGISGSKIKLSQEQMQHYFGDAIAIIQNSSI